MAENKRVYTITISGLTESYENVKNLKEALDSLSDTVVNVTKEESKTASERKTSAESTDALAKATQKLEEYDKAYQTELAKVNAELSANKKEISEAIKLQQAEATVNGEVGNSYREKQQYLSALNTLIRNNTLETEEQNQKQQEWIQQSASLQAELKSIDAEMEIYVRNVGNYGAAADRVVEGHKSIKQELKELKTEMADMLANGVSKTDEGYLKLAERAGQLKDALGDANQDIANFASDTRGMTNAINLAQSAVGAYQLYNSTMELFGAGNEDAAESMKKMMAVMTVLNSLQQVQNSLLENGSATARLYNKAIELVQAALGIKKAAVEEDIAVTEASTVAEEANTVANELNATASETNAASTGTATTAEATNTTTTTSNTVAKEANTVATNKMSLAQKAGAVASNILSVALRAIPLMAVIGLVMALIQNWESIWNWFKKTFPVLDTLSKKFNKFGGLMNAIVTGAKAVAAAVVNWLINPFKTFANVVGKILEGDFKGAWQAALDGVKNQFKGTIDAFNNEVVKGYARGQEEMTMKQAKEEDKRLTHHNNMITKQKNADGTYRKEYIEDTQKMYDNRKKMYKKDSDEYRKVLEDEAKFHQQVEDAKTAASEKAAKERTKAAEKAAKDAEKAAEELQKKTEALAKANEKALTDMQKLIFDTAKLASTNMADTYKRVEEESFKARNAAAHQADNLKIQIDQSKRKLEEFQTALKKNREEYAKTGDEFYDVTAKRNAQFIEHETANLNLLYAKLQQTQDEIAKHQDTIVENTWKRQSIMVEMFAAEATKTQKEFQDKLQDYAKQMFETEEILSQKLTDEKRKYFNDQLADLKDKYDKTLKAMEDQLGDYFTKEIPLDVNIDFDGILERLAQLPAAMQNVLNTNKIAEYILGIDGTTEDLFDRIVKGAALTEFKEQFYDAAEAAGAAKNKLEEIDALIKSDLSFDLMRERLHAYRNEMNLTEDEFNSLFDAIVQNASTDKGVVETFKTLGYVVGLTKEQINQLQGLMLQGLPIDELKKQVEELFSLGNVQLNKFGTLAYTVNKDAENISKNVAEQIKKSYQDALTNANKLLTDADKSIKKFQDATKGIKFEPVIEQYKGLFEEFDRGLGITKLNVEKTKERYANLKKSYNDYLASIQKGSAQMIQWEAAWQAKLENTKILYGENSMEYRQAQDEKVKADAAYVAERERVSQQIEDIERGENELDWDGVKNNLENLGKILQVFQNEVMSPIFDGLSDLFSLQVEEAQEALDEITELYDKAVEAREQSADRLKEINEELRNDDGQNKEALQQRLAEEEVLLVQREEAERALQKEKAKREYEVEVAEYNQRKFELSQKLIEGLVNTALGITAALKYGPILGPIFAAIIGAMGALQTGIISKQIGNLKKPTKKFGEGGKVGEQGVSRSHKQGGHRIENTNIEVEGGEWVINKKSSKKYDSLLKSINDDNVGLVRKQVEIIREKRIVNNTNQIAKFASGGQINTLTATNAVRENNEIAAISELIKAIDFQPTVSVVDINRVNKRLVRVQDLSGKAV